MVSLSRVGHQRPKGALEKLRGIPATIQQPLYSGRSEGKAKKLCGQLNGQKLLLAPPLQWCVEHDLEITAMYRTIDYRTWGIFTWFVDEVNQRRVDEDPDKALLEEVFKLLGNSAYRKLIGAKERQTRVIYTKDQSVVDKAKRSVWFDNMFELAFHKDKVKINRPFQVGICWRSAVAISKVGVREVLFCQLFAFALCFDPVKKLLSFFLVFGISGLVSLKSFVVFFFLRGGLWVITRKKKGQLIAPI